MLPFGKLRVTAKEGGGDSTKFTSDEQQTVMTLWSIFRSPLIFGGDLPSNDEATTALITNEEVLAVNQHSSGGHQVFDKATIRAWVANGAKPDDRYVAIFNLGETAQDVHLTWSELGISGSVSNLRDLWTHKTNSAHDGIYTALRPHASALYKLGVASR
jgi:hypothetical protein